MTSILLLTLTGYVQDAQELVNKGNAKSKLKDFRGAAEFTKAIEIDTGNAEVYYDRGVANFISC